MCSLLGSVNNGFDVLEHTLEVITHIILHTRKIEKCPHTLVLPMPAGFHLCCSGRRNGEVWLGDASGCEGPGTNPSAFPALRQTDTPQETLDWTTEAVIHHKVKESRNVFGLDIIKQLR